MNSYTKFQETTLLLLRLIVGAIFMYAGWAKWGFWSAAPESMPGIMVYLIKFLSIVEPLGAAAIFAGFLTRWAAAGCAVIMAGAIFILHFTMHAGLFTTAQGTGLDYNLLILTGCMVIMAFGPGRWSVDGMRKKT